MADTTVSITPAIAEMMALMARMDEAVIEWKKGVGPGTYHSLSQKICYPWLFVRVDG